MPANRHFCLLSALWIAALLLVESPCIAEPRDEISAVYARTYKAAKMKYAYGMTSHRSLGFKAYDLDGLELDPEVEFRGLVELLAQSLSVKETGEILSVKPLDGGKVRCEVLDTIEAIVIPDAGQKRKNRLVIKTRSLEDWVQTSRGWEQASCKLLEQTQTTTPLDP